MRAFVRRGWMCGLLAGGAMVAIAAADGTPASVSDEKVSRLETLLEAQQAKIAQLENQIAAAGGQDMDKARVEEMKRQIREVLSEQEFRSSLMPSALQAGYDNGFYLGSSDEKFLMKFNGAVQFRWQHYATRSDNRYLLPRFERDDRTGFDIQRARIALSGHAYSKDLTYNLTMRADAPDAWDVVIHYAWVNYRFADEFQVKAGVFQNASTRSQLLMDQERLQFVDRGLFDAVYGLGVSTGVRFWGQLFDKRLVYMIDVVNSLNSPANRTITPDPAEHDNNPALLARLVWHIMGENNDDEFAGEGDLRKDKSQLAMDFGFSYAFNEDRGDRNTTRIPFAWNGWNPGRGGFGLTTTNGLQINQFSWDLAMKYMGLSLTGEYAVRVVDPRTAWRRPFAPWWLLTGDDSTTAQHGAYVQAGYFLPIAGLEDKIELVARVGGISALSGEQEGTWEYAVGANYYIEGHKVKLQTDMVKTSEVPITNSYSSLANVNDDALVFRVQMQVSF
ncbi:MAG: hypothetical protein HZB38_07005 [Planctomycetes bacterium]|nr:hypothetical protein [Planctomycetota bacterium]